jgi:hypothetical protein
MATPQVLSGLETDVATRMKAGKELARKAKGASGQTSSGVHSLAAHSIVYGNALVRPSATALALERKL